MDKYIDMMTIYWMDWQQTAIANTVYSVVLVVLACLIGGFIVVILKRGEIARLMQQLMQERQLLEQAENKHEELLNQQKNDAEQISEIQQQLEQATANLQQEKEVHQSSISDKDELFIKSADEKKREINALNSTLNEKNQFVEQLQHELNEQKANIAQYAEVQEKIVEMKKQANQSTAELDAVKQQLETELNNKNELAEQLDTQEQLAKRYMDRVSELELQLEKMSNPFEIEEMQQQIEKQEGEKAPLEEDKRNAEGKIELIVEPIAEPVSQNNEKQGVVNMGSFSSLENNESTDNNLKREDVPQTDQRDTEQLSQQIPVKPEPAASVEKVPTIKERPEPVAEEAEEAESSFSEKLVEVADKMDAFQDKLKGYFNKNRS